MNSPSFDVIRAAKDGFKDGLIAFLGYCYKKEKYVVRFVFFKPPLNLSSMLSDGSLVRNVGLILQIVIIYI